MKSYKSHKVVQAARIEKVIGYLVEGVTLILDDNTEVEQTANWSLKHEPQAGQYYVVYPNGHMSASPAQAFEEGYTEVMANGLTEAETLQSPSVAGLTPARALSRAESIAVDALLEIVELPPIRLRRDIAAELERQAAESGVIVQAKAREILEAAAKSEPSTFQDRVRTEVSELRTKIARLETFTRCGEPWEVMPLRERQRLISQLYIMRQYAEILDERIAAFEREAA